MKRPRPLSLDLSAQDFDDGGAALFLGRFDAERLRHELAQAGILEALANLGYPDPMIEFDRQGCEHRLWVRSAVDGTADREGGRDDNLVELRLAEATSLVEEPELRALGIDVISLLCVHWLALQNPRGAFTPARPRLPGQRHPGLSLSRRFYQRVRAWAEAWGKDALLNRPEYFHNAIFYAAIFRFLSAREQGRFEALCRDLAHLHVAEASAVVAAGVVIEEPGGSPFVWAPGEMVAPIMPALRAGLASAGFLAAVAQARETVRFRVVPAQR